MLRKLLKYEWKDTRKLLLPINLAIVLITIIGCLMLSTSIFDSEMGFLLAIPLLILYILAIITFSCITLVYVYARFYRNLYTAEGYLMHTLPVTHTQLFHSKLIMGYFWFSLNSLLTTLSTSALGGSVGFHEAAKEISGGTSESFIDDFILSTGQTPDSFSFADIFGFTLPIFLLILFVMLLVSSFSSVLMGYVSVLFGQRMERNKLAASVAIYFGIYMAIQILTSLAVVIPEIFKIGTNLEDESVNFLAASFQTLLPSMIICYLVIDIIFYVVCRILVRRPVNLD